MRYGITILPEFSWREAAPLWRGAEELGFDHAWTYDHLVWGGLPDSPWYSAVPTLTAAALATERVRLGTLVATPNYRHPYLLLRDLLTVDDISQGRLLCGLGTGGDLDSGILGEQHTVAGRVARFREFVELLDELLRRDHVDHEGEWYTTRDARTLPGPVQRPRVPFVVAANGPKSMRLAVEHGQGWLTTGPSDALDLEDWWTRVAGLTSRLDSLLEQAGDARRAGGERAEAGEAAPAEVGEAAPAEVGGDLDRYVLLDAAPAYALESVDLFDDMVGRAEELGFTDVVTHWPRPDSPYAGRLAVLEEVASRHLGDGVSN